MAPPSLDVPKTGKMSSGHGKLQGSARRPSSKHRLHSKTRRDVNTVVTTGTAPGANRNDRHGNTVCGGSWCARSFECSCGILRYWMLLAALGGVVVIQQVLSLSRVRGTLGPSLASHQRGVNSERIQLPRVADLDGNALVPPSGHAVGLQSAVGDGAEIHQHTQGEVGGQDERQEDGTPQGVVEGDEKNDQEVIWREAEDAGFPDDIGGGGRARQIRASSVLLGIPTVPRPKGVDYLEQTLQAVLSQCQAQSQQAAEEDRGERSCELSVLVMNVHGEGHGPFDEARRRYEGRECVTFLTVGEAVDLEGNKIEVGEGDHLSNKMPLKRKVLPLAKVQKQTRDLVYLLKAAAGRAKNYMFMEDDMQLCEGGLAAIKRMLDKANIYHPDWIAIRASFGMNGILIPDKDVLPFAAHLERYQKYRPPDHLVVEWFGGETPETVKYKGNRRHLAFRYNIFEHLGRVSTLRGKPSPSYPSCFEELTTKTLFEVEAFDYKRCPEDDISPCNVPDSAKAGFPKIEWRFKYGKKRSSR